MFKAAIATFIPILASFCFLLFVPLPKPTYHSLYISNSLSDNASISHFLYTLTRQPHIAGSEANSDAATYVLSTLTSSNIHSHIVPYNVALTLPYSLSLTLTPPPPDPPVNFELRQKIYDGDPYADVAGQVVPTFHAYAKSGSVTGPVVYVNYGRVEDYVTLKEMGVNVSLVQLFWRGMDKFSEETLCRTQTWKGLLGLWFIRIGKTMAVKGGSQKRNGCQRVGSRWVRCLVGLATLLHLDGQVLKTVGGSTMRRLKMEVKFH